MHTIAGTPCRATRVALHVSQLISWNFIAFCRCSTGVALHPPKNFGVAPPPPCVPGGVAPKFGSEKVSRYTGVSQLQLRVSRYTVQLRRGDRKPNALRWQPRVACREGLDDWPSRSIPILTGQTWTCVLGVVSCHLECEMKSPGLY